LKANELTQGGTVTLYNNLANFPPHFFQVLITYQQDLQATNSPQTAVQRLQTMRQLQLAVQAIIEQEKPAHTYYALEFALTNTMQLLSLEQAQQQQKEMLRLGQNTLLGTTVREVGQIEEEYNE
jgi:hypothetical protein